MNDKSYVFDINKIMEFCFDLVDERTNDSEITESYVVNEENNKLEVVSKQVREIKGSDNTSKNTIRYDMIKMFIDVLVNADNGEQRPLTFGEAIIINTMINENLIREI